jgi:hypothetical protein
VIFKQFTIYSASEMSASIAYIAAATNRFNQAADVSPSSNLIAFGSSRLLALWNLDVSPFVLNPLQVLYNPL